jgi:SAM dependent carboxyl methyltransferase
MSHETSYAPSAMEGNGCYNKHAKQPAEGAALALPHLERVIESMTLNCADRPIVIADYGSSQGKNSLTPMRLAVNALRRRLSQDRSILVYHVDRSSNDFNSLFELLDTDPDRYGRNDPNVFPCAIGRSFYGNVLPSNYVDVGWSSYAAMWVSRIPTSIPDHFSVFASTGAIRAEFDRQGALDWEVFLSLRAAELRPGGHLIVVMPGVHKNGVHGFEGIMDHTNEVLVEMVREGTITAAERARMVLGVWPRTKRELLAPFSHDGQFHNLMVEHSETSLLTDPWWANYERDGDHVTLATRHAQFFRAIFVPTLASALDRVRAGDAEALQAFADGVETGLRRRLATQPTLLHSVVETIVIAKQGSA